MKQSCAKKERKFTEKINAEDFKWDTHIHAHIQRSTQCTKTMGQFISFLYKEPTGLGS